MRYLAVFNQVIKFVIKNLPRCAETVMIGRNVLTCSIPLMQEVQ